MYVPDCLNVSMSSSRSHRSLSPEQPTDFKTEFHPRSRHPPLFQQQDAFSLQDAREMAPDSHPWCPFVEEGDYLFAEIALQAGLNASQVNSLLNLMLRMSQGKAKISLRNEIDLRRAWNRAAMQVTPVSVLHVSFTLQEKLPFSFTFSLFSITWLLPTRARTGHSHSTPAHYGIGL